MGPSAESWSASFFPFQLEDYIRLFHDCSIYLPYQTDHTMIFPYIHICIHVYVSMYLCIYIYIQINVCLHNVWYTCTYIYIFTRTYTCISRYTICLWHFVEMKVHSHHSFPVTSQELLWFWALGAESCQLQRRRRGAADRAFV